MGFDLNCPSCGQVLEAENDWVGMEFECPACHGSITIPPEEEEEIPATVKTDVKKVSLVKNVPPPASAYSGSNDCEDPFKDPFEDSANTPAPKGAGLAITGMVLGILSLTCIGGILSIPAIIVSAIALFKVSKKTAGGFGFALTGVITGTLGLLTLPILAGMLLPALSSARDKAREITSINNMKQIQLALNQYASDYKGKYPPYSGAKGLNLLRKGNYLLISKVFVNPSSETTQAAPGQTLTEKNTDYGYKGGLTTSSKSKMPILWEKQYRKRGNYRNALLVNGQLTRQRDL